MSTAIAKQISTRMRAKNLSVQELEKEAGLKRNAVQNILRGVSKRPNAETLKAVGDILGCTVNDLFDEQEMYYDEDIRQSKNKLLGHKYEYPDLFLETVKLVNTSLKQKDHELTIEQLISCIEEIYLHSLQKNPSKVDREFAEWWIDLATD